MVHSTSQLKKKVKHTHTCIYTRSQKQPNKILHYLNNKAYTISQNHKRTSMSAADDDASAEREGNSRQLGQQRKTYAQKKDLILILRTVSSFSLDE